jgi:hypothetical protein
VTRAPNRFAACNFRGDELGRRRFHDLDGSLWVARCSARVPVGESRLCYDAARGLAANLVDQRRA